MSKTKKVKKKAENSYKLEKGLEEFREQRKRDRWDEIERKYRTR